MQKRYLALGGGIAAIWLLDFLTKRLAESLLAAPIEFAPFLRFALTRNSQLALGIPFPLVLTVFCSLAAIGVFVWLFVKNVKKDSKMGTLVFALLLGGATGNLAERLASGGVTDFVSLLWIPNFNLADAALTVGALLLILFSKKIFSK